MATLTGQGVVSVHGDTSSIDSTARVAVGTRQTDTAGNEYIYLGGCASTGVGSWVSYTGAFATTLLTANAVGPVAIAMAATVASTYGWYLIWGNHAAAKADTVAADKALFIDATNGRADDDVVTGDLIVNAYSTAAASGNVMTVFIAYPYVLDVLG